MGAKFSNDGHVVAVVVAFCGLAFTGTVIYKANLGPVSNLWWIALFSSTIAGVAVALLNLVANWTPPGSSARNVADAPLATVNQDTAAPTPNTARPHSTRMTQIGFDYLQNEIPLNRGWTVISKSEDGTGEFSIQPVDGYRRLLMMTKGEWFSIDHAIPPNAQVSKRVTFSIMYYENTMVFFEFAVKTQDGRASPNKWVKVELGSSRPIRTLGYGDVEYTIYVEGVPQPNGWILMDLSLPWIIEQTWQQDGLQYEKVLKMRLRGNVFISAIDFFA